MNPVAILTAPTLTPISKNSGGICMDKLKFSTSSTTLLSMIGIKIKVPLLPGDMFAFIMVESKSIPLPNVIYSGYYIRITVKFEVQNLVQ